jgi:prepilin-type N-terminal cleavage/methylation domain-containing protein
VSPRERGLTLIELLVTVTLLGVVGSIVTGAVVVFHRSVRTVSDESSGLADVRKGAERLSRDIRDARGITVSSDAAYTATAQQLTVWIDANSDYQQQTSETVTWKVASVGSGRYNLVRAVKGGTTTTQARSLVSSVAFRYYKESDNTGSTAPSSADGYVRVHVDMTYNDVGVGIADRHVVFDTRMRNTA